MPIFYHECQLCGYPIPFDPAFEVEAARSGKVVVKGVKTSATFIEMSEHMEQHDELWDQDGELNWPVEDIWDTKEAINE